MPQTPNPTQSRPAKTPQANQQPIDAHAVLATCSSAEPISESEYEALKGALEVLRGDKPNGFHSLQQEVLERVVRARSENDLDVAAFICGAIEQYFTNSRNESINGFISSGEIILLEESHAETLLELAAILKNGSWIGDFIASMAILEREQRLTPMDVARGLVNDIQQFDIDLDITRRTLRLYPTLFAAAAASEPQESR